MKLFFTLAFLVTSIGCTQTNTMNLDNWKCECNSELTSISLEHDIIDIVSPDGNTVWFDEKLTGNYKISYKITVVDEGGEFDRLSDLNCFWGANDPEYPENIYARADWRNGIFKHYNTMNLFYCGFGGNHNETTRFRKYHGDLYKIKDAEVKPILKEYTKAPNLLEKGHWYTIEIVVKDNMTSYTIDGRTIFTHQIEKGECDGYFALRFWKNHIKLTNFNIEKL